MPTDIFTKWFDLEPLLDEDARTQLVTVCSFDRATVPDEDVKRLEEKSLVFTFPEQQDELAEALVA
jgi:hypothetical protein